MDFAQPHIYTESVTTKSNIRHIPTETKDDNSKSLDELLVEAANQAAIDLFESKDLTVDSSLYPERLIPQSETIQEDSLVVIFESFDNLNFCYAKKGEIFNNRNGHFHHGKVPHTLFSYLKRQLLKTLTHTTYFSSSKRRLYRQAVRMQN